MIRLIASSLVFIFLLGTMADGADENSLRSKMLSSPGQFLTLGSAEADRTRELLSICRTAISNPEKYPKLQIAAATVLGKVASALPFEEAISNLDSQEVEEDPRSGWPHPTTIYPVQSRFVMQMPSKITFRILFEVAHKKAGSALYAKLAAQVLETEWNSRRVALAVVLAWIKAAKKEPKPFGALLAELQRR